MISLNRIAHVIKRPSDAESISFADIEVDDRSDRSIGSAPERIRPRTKVRARIDRQAPNRARIGQAESKHGRKWTSSTSGFCHDLRALFFCDPAGSQKVA